jgi:putative DNA primase/helicase
MIDVNTATNAELDAEIFRLDRGQVTGIDFERFLALEIPPRRCLLAPWLPQQGLAMIHAPRGIGKTHIALGTAWAVATGTGFLKWKVPDDVGARRVVVLDGEMPAVVLQERLRAITADCRHTPPLPDYLTIVASDMRRDGLPDLADPAAQRFYCDVIADAELIVVDNISSLCRGMKENDADSWTPVQSWLLAQRRAGKSVLVIHHSGKSGAQRGTSRKEDALDTVITLKRPPDYQAGQGARFEIHFEKARGFYGPEAEPFEVQMIGNQWALSEIKSDDGEILQALQQQGLTIRQISERTGLSKSAVDRRLRGGGDDD